MRLEGNRRSGVPRLAHLTRAHVAIPAGRNYRFHKHERNVISRIEAVRRPELAAAPSIPQVTFHCSSAFMPTDGTPGAEEAGDESC